MANPTLSARLAGLQCSHCNSEVRDLSQVVCPECGKRLDPRPRDFALRSPNPTTGWIAAAVAVMSGVFILWYSTGLALTYFREMGGWCGTARMAVTAQMTLNVPILLLVPAAACVVSRRAQSGFLVARTAAITAGFGWLTCYLIIFFSA